MLKMFILKFLLLASCYIVYGLESSEELEALLANRTIAPYIRKAVGKIYNEQKLETISALEKKLRDLIDNVTLVGSQNIYNNNGEIVEIGTVELHLPRIPSKVELSLFEETNDDDEDITISQVSHLFNQISALGFKLVAEAEEFNKDEEIITQTYIEDDLYYQYFDEQHIINRTIEVDSLVVVEKAIADLKKEHERISVHKFDDKRQFVSEGSNIVPEYVVERSKDGIVLPINYRWKKHFQELLNRDSHVEQDVFNKILQKPTQYYMGEVLLYQEVGTAICQLKNNKAMITAGEGEVHQELIDEILKGSSALFIESNDDFEDVVPSELVKYLRSKFNTTDFYVVSGEPDAWYLREDNSFKVSVEYDLNSWDSNDEIIFTVFGVKTM